MPKRILIPTVASAGIILSIGIFGIAVIVSSRQLPRLNIAKEWVFLAILTVVFVILVLSVILLWKGKKSAADTQKDEETAHLAKLVEDISEAIYSADMSYNTKSWNKAAESLFDFTGAEVIGKPINEIIRSKVTDDDRMLIRDELKNAGYWRGEVICLKKDGTPVFTLMSNTVTRNAKGEIDGYVGICRDISERKKLEEQLEKANEELEAFSYSVSHDLRAPLRIIDGYADILVSDYSDMVDEEGKRLLGVIMKSTRKMGLLIDELLNLSNLGRKKMLVQKVNMNLVVESVIKDLNILPGSGIEIKVPGLLPATCDRGLIENVWNNLISNAIKYSAKKKTCLIEINSTLQNTQVVYSVKDNGVGFNMKYAHKLFGVFQRLHRATDYEGIGVGLALVKRIVIRNKGTVWAEAEENKGAVFYFSLPV